MLIAILSDIHGNLEAFTEVIKDMESRCPEKVICLGDIIGYGPDPNGVAQLFLEKKYLSTQGNHEAALTNPRLRKWLNFQAEENSIASEQLLSSESYAFCTTLPRTITLEKALFVHGFPPESLIKYATLISDKKYETYFKNCEEKICFVGHTHDLLLVSWDGKTVKKEKISQSSFKLNDGIKYMINVGSVGQPRDGDSTAKYFLWDSSTNRVEVRRIPYDIKETVRKIRDRGFPDAYGIRLG